METEFLTRTDEKCRSGQVISDFGHNINGFKKHQNLMANKKNPPKLPYTGSLFQHSDGLAPIGLWLMPDQLAIN